MSGAEIGIAVIGAVAALITAYRDAGAIVENIKEKRKSKGSLPPSVALQESLEEGHQEIEKITAKGVQRFGVEFEQGDDIAHRALQALTVEVQASFLHHLTLASKDDNFINFEACIDSAIEARLRAVTILNELYLRQQKRSNLQAEPEVVVSQPSPKPAPPLRVRHPSAEMKEVVLPPESKQPPERREAREPQELKKRSNTLESENPPSPLRSRKSSWNPFKSVHRTSCSDEKEMTLGPASASRASSSYVTSPTLSPRPTTMSSSPGSLNEFRRSQVMTPPISPISTHSSVDALAAAGFCKGAYAVQQGVYEKAIQVSMKNMEWACHCRKCGFTTPADRDGRGRPRFDDRIHTAKALRFRSLLLFKSHLGSSHKKRRVYKCLICVFGGDSSSSYDGEDHLLEHVSHHQGGILNDVELWGPICLEPTGPRMGSERTFDVCFADNPRFALPPSSVAVEMDVRTEIVEADSGFYPEDVFKNQWAEEERH